MTSSMLPVLLLTFITVAWECFDLGLNLQFFVFRWLSYLWFFLIKF